MSGKRLWSALASMRGGGTQRVCLRLCNAWAEMGIGVELALVAREGPYLTELDPRVRIHDLRAGRLRRCLPALVRFARAGAPAPLLVFGCDLGSVAMLGRLTGLINVPVIVREGNIPSSNVGFFGLLCYRFLIKHADRVIAQNLTIRSELACLGVPLSRISVIHNPVPQFSLGEEAPQAAGRGTLLLAVGRLEHQKGFDRLLVGLAGYLRSHPCCRLAILGEGSEQARLTSLAGELGVAEQVDLPGFQHNMESWYRRAALFIHSSRYEGQPNALMEAIACGCKVLCFAGKGGTRELMAACGLEDMVIPDADAEGLLAKRVEETLMVGRERFVEARKRLEQLAGVQAIACEYARLCGLHL